MDSAVIPLLRCPSCERGALTSSVLLRVTNERRIKDALLSCQDCHVHFPVIDWIPRLVVSAEQTAEEKAFIFTHTASRHDTPIIVVDSALTISEKDREEQIRVLLKEKLRPTDEESEKSKRRSAHDCAYRLHHAGATEKYVHTIRPYCTTPIDVLADLGGGQGGTVSTFRRLLNPRIALLIDYDLDYAVIARLRDPAITVIRADARALPFQDAAIDLLVSFATLEHIAELPRVVHEITRTSAQAFLSFNPNKWSVYDFGHLQSPVTLLPRSFIPIAAWLWHRVNGYRWSHAAITTELRTVFYHSRQAVARLLRSKGNVRNVFPDFVVHSADASYAYRFAGLKTFFRKYPRFLRTLARIVVTLGIEPNVYLFWRQK